MQGSSRRCTKRSSGVPSRRPFYHFAGEVRGELTLVVEGEGPAMGVDFKSGLDTGMPGPDGERSGRDCPDWRDELKLSLSGGLSSKEAASAIARRFDLPRRVVYQAALAMKKE